MIAANLWGDDGGIGGCAIKTWGVNVETQQVRTYNPLKKKHSPLGGGIIIIPLSHQKQERKKSEKQ